MRRLTRAAVALFALVGCARMAPPPGGPPDASPPRLIATIPESVAVLDGFDGWVEFQFDEVISEGSSPNFGIGSGDLERLVLLSPGNEVPRVAWHRTRIAVKPRGGWRPNTVYRVELVRGLRDLRQNVSDTAAIVTFSTGGALPTHELSGRAVDWAGQRAFPAALVEAMLLPDSLVYRSVTDSAGRFRMHPMPEGEYLVTITLDQDHNRRRSGREAWDTVRVRSGIGAVGEVWAFQRDTLPPRIVDVAPRDSLSITITLTQPVDPALRIAADAIIMRSQDDSLDAGPIGALPRAVHDSLYRAATPRAANDSAARDSLVPSDSAARARPVRVAPPLVPRREGATPPDTLEQKRPSLSTQLVVRVRSPLVPGTRYVVVVRGVRAVGGAVADSIRGSVEIPKPAPRDTTTRVRPDTTRRTPADTTRRAPADTTTTPSVREAAAVRRPR